MSEPIAAFSSSQITGQELVDCAIVLGGIATPKDSFLAFIQRDEKYIWLALSHEAISDEDRKIIESVLGSPALTMVIIDIGQDEGTIELAIEFLEEFSKHWPLVIDTLRGPIYSLDELVDRYARNIPLW